VCGETDYMTLYVSASLRISLNQPLGLFSGRLKLTNDSPSSTRKIVGKRRDHRRGSVAHSSTSSKDGQC
jgi:hypothetical protein